MNRNAVETFRLEADEDSQGGEVAFDWSTGTMTVTWDDGQTETWSRRGCDMDAQANAFFLFTGQVQRYRANA